ncbi:geranylgeranyl pyrophosphate synthase 11 [Striga asiatica]|uniref:Geranylgeranyl pyrophosphate synthase 11 n=1 Tax=Striga asiatica TaxID=4170 RepID=A0A5A7QGS5_STRAF|nr:geranylgeranyl pyrophosphate synthase 11 [Striga asiatica]
MRFSYYFTFVLFGYNCIKYGQIRFKPLDHTNRAISLKHRRIENSLETPQLRTSLRRALPLFGVPVTATRLLNRPQTLPPTFHPTSRQTPRPQPDAFNHRHPPPSGPAASPSTAADHFSTVSLKLRSVEARAGSSAPVHHPAGNGPFLQIQAALVVSVLAVSNRRRPLLANLHRRPSFSVATPPQSPQQRLSAPPNRSELPLQQTRRRPHSSEPPSPGVPSTNSVNSRASVGFHGSENINWIEGRSEMRKGSKGERKRREKKRKGEEKKKEKENGK